MSDRHDDGSGSRRAGQAGMRGRHHVRLREFSKSVPMALMRARESVMRHFRPSLRRHDLTEQQWRVLRALHAEGELEITELAQVSFLLGPSLTRILKDLEARALVTRRAVESDLRRSVVSITPEGVKLIQVVAPESEAIYAEIARRFGGERLADLMETLQDLEDAMREEMSEGRSRDTQP